MLLGHSFSGHSCQNMPLPQVAISIPANDFQGFQAGIQSLCLLYVFMER